MAVATMRMELLEMVDLQTTMITSFKTCKGKVHHAICHGYGGESENGIQAMPFMHRIVRAP